MIGFIYELKKNRKKLTKRGSLQGFLVIHVDIDDYASRFDSFVRNLIFHLGRICLKSKKFLNAYLFHPHMWSLKEKYTLVSGLFKHPKHYTHRGLSK